MARPGPAPKARQHGHNAANFQDVPNLPYDGPGSTRDLPEMAGGMQWFPEVTVWWEIVRVMPHCRLWEATDWMFAIHTAYLWQNYWGEFWGGSPSATMATELRRREDIMGMTLEARRKNLIRYIDPALAADEADDAEATEKPEPGEGAPAEGVRPISSARSRRQQLAG